MCGLGYIVNQLARDLSFTHAGSIFPYFLVGIALLIAVGFEFVNGFHDTTNAVVTVTMLAMRQMINDIQNEVTR